MKKAIALFCMLVILPVIVAGCSNGKPASSTSATNAPTAVVTQKPLEGTAFKTDKFTITVPSGWESMEVNGGVQLYKMSGEIIEVHYRGSDQSDDSAKQQVESNATQYSGTTPKEVDLLGKKFWATTFTASGVKQTSYIRMENGVMLSIKCAGSDHETNPVFASILNSIIFN
jgi:hypothetical protein